MDRLAAMIAGIIWISGIIIAKGFWSTFFAVITFGFYSTYLICEILINKYFLPLI